MSDPEFTIAVKIDPKTRFIHCPKCGGSLLFLIVQGTCQGEAIRIVSKAKHKEMLSEGFDGIAEFALHQDLIVTWHESSVEWHVRHSLNCPECYWNAPYDEVVFWEGQSNDES